MGDQPAQGPPKTRAAGGRQDRTCRAVADGIEAIREGRYFVREQVGTRGAVASADDAELIAAELLANAHQHGLPPVTVCVAGGSDVVRIEVTDTNPRSPVRPAESATNMTGRGLALVEAISSRWGVERIPGGGKTVWAELASDTAPPAEPVDIDALLEQWDDDLPAGPERFTVVLGDVPTDLLIEAKAHVDNLVREFQLAASATNAEVPQHLAELIETVVTGFAEARDAIKRQALAAAGRGDPRTLLTLHLPLHAADAGEAYLRALDEADEYSRAARLLTLETPPEHRLFRHWYVEAVVAQLRTIAAGAPTEPVQGFEERLVEEIRRLSESQRVSERAARLQRATAALARARTPEDVGSVVVSEGVAALGASGGALLVPSEDGVHLALPGVVGYGEKLVDALREERLDAPLPAATALRTGEAVWLESREERDEQFPALRGFEASVVSMCAVPLVVAGRSIGALRFSFATRKLFDDDERAFVMALAALTGQTLQRTEVYQAERRASLELQRALLPLEPETIPGWEIAAYYSPAGDQEAGGDFYDILPITDERIIAVVGDVMGRGVEAAAAMAQIRSTIRAYAVADPDPVNVFTAVDKFFDRLAVEQLVTVLYFLADSDTDTVHIANAGHLSPIIVDQSGSREVPTAAGTPFGVGQFERRVSSVALPPGAALVAITDGLVERRGEDIDEGIARVVESCAESFGWDADRLLRHVVKVASAERAHDDDVTVLVLRRT
ncbi:MAG: SpoIIE family protein phosphatase [Frankiaceae bacterium]|nr:SpoIIE family protein phosphatase [Frankiaceae bacterium]MBV9368949.1 SpoIIE family protein phosphatase [Frankiales bacterium]